MVQKKKLAKGRLDKFYYLAKEQGFRSRAAFKLIQLNKKYNFLGNAKACLDLCAAPGGWMQVASKYMPVQSVIVGVDLDPIRPIRNCVGLQEDITTAKCRTEIKKSLKTWKVDVCLHDGAPNMGTSWVQDSYQQAELTLHALKLATEFLTAGGWFVTKVFRGPDYNSLLWVFHQLFKKVESTKPQASRNVSAEIFVVCQGFLAPKRLDPKLLDPKHVFKESKVEAQVINVLKDNKIRANREGYDEGVNHLHKTATVKEFVEGNEHIKLLGTVHSLTFDVESKIYADHPLTTPEVKECLKDLKVLNKHDFKNLVQWKNRMAEYKESLVKKEAGEESDSEEEEEISRDSLAAKYPNLSAEELDANLEKLMEDSLNRINKKKKRDKRKSAEKKREERIKLQLKMTISGDQIEQSEEADLFDLKEVDDEFETETSKHEDLGSDDEEGFTKGSDDESDEDRELDYNENDDGVNYENEDSDAEMDRYELMEEQMDAQYQQYLENVKSQGPIQPKRLAKDRLVDDDITDLNVNREADEDDLEHRLRDRTSSLLVGGKRKSENSFFGNSLFDGIEEEDLEQSIKKSKSNERKPIIKKQQQKEEEEKAAAAAAEEEQQPKSKKEKKREAARANRDKKLAKHQVDPGVDLDSKKKSKAGSFEVVPLEPDMVEEEPYDERNEDDDGMVYEEMPEENLDYSSDEGEGERDDKVMTLAMGTHMLRKKHRMEMEDDAYNRYVFNDQNLPKWFVDQDNKHNQPIPCVTRDMVNEIKREIKEINSRPIKKIAEAKARKKRREIHKMENAKAKANTIVDNEEMSTKEKIKAIERVYQKTGQTRNSRKLTVVTHKKFKAGNYRVGSKYKVVDRRMKKELRSKKSKEKKANK